jgi:hypothetical protein
MRDRLRRRARRGATLVEFALIAPALFMLLIGIYDVSALSFLALSLERATIEGARLGAAAAPVEGVDRLGAVRQSISEATLGLLDDDGLRVEARVYEDVAALAAAEWLDDTNGDGKANAGEAFADVNGNGVWDGDPGVAGAGGAEAHVLYTVSASYRLVTPFIGAALGPVTLRASAHVVNEPF